MITQMKEAAEVFFCLFVLYVHTTTTMHVHLPGFFESSLVKMLELNMIHSPVFYQKFMNLIGFLIICYSLMEHSHTCPPLEAVVIL